MGGLGASDEFDGLNGVQGHLAAAHGSSVRFEEVHVVPGALAPEMELVEVPGDGGSLLTCTCTCSVRSRRIPTDASRPLGSNA